MTTIPAKDAAVLAYLARHKNANPARTKRLTSKMTGRALAIAKALTGERATKPASRAAKGLSLWVADNEKIAKRSFRRVK